MKWGSQLGAEINIQKGTRQGGLSSPFLFNVFYQNMINGISELTGGIRIGTTSYNVFCYADDILLTSLTVTGLQAMIDYANTDQYIYHRSWFTVQL